MFGLSGIALKVFAVLVLICVLLAGACYVLWRMERHDDHRADVAEAALAAEKTNAKIVTKLVDRVVEVPSAPVIRERIVRGVCRDAGVPGAGRADAAAGADAPHRLPDDADWFTGELSREIAAAARNQAKLDALHEALGPQQ